MTSGIWEYCFQRENYLSKIPSTSIQYSEKLADDKAGSKFCWCEGLDALSYIKPGIGKNPALFSKVNLSSWKEEESAHQDMPTWSGLKMPALLLFQLPFIFKSERDAVSFKISCKKETRICKLKITLLRKKKWRIFYTRFSLHHCLHAYSLGLFWM